MTNRFDRELIRLFNEVEEIDIETRADDSATRTTIWVVTVGDVVYVRSVRGSRGQWYQRLLAQPDAFIYVENRRVRLRAHHVDDEQTIARVSDEYAGKYASSPYMPPMLEPETLPTTLQLDPA
jgi:hypothetical protein